MVPRSEIVSRTFKKLSDACSVRVCLLPMLRTRAARDCVIAGNAMMKRKPAPCSIASPVRIVPSICARNSACARPAPSPPRRDSNKTIGLFGEAGTIGNECLRDDARIGREQLLLLTGIALAAHEGLKLLAQGAGIAFEGCQLDARLILVVRLFLDSLGSLDVLRLAAAGDLELAARSFENAPQLGIQLPTQ